MDASDRETGKNVTGKLIREEAGWVCLYLIALTTVEERYKLWSS